MELKPQRKPLSYDAYLVNIGPVLWFKLTILFSQIELIHFNSNMNIKGLSRYTNIAMTLGRPLGLTR